MEDEFEFTPDPEDIAREVFEEMSEEEQEQFFHKLEQDRTNDSRDQWSFMYGFNHECSCASDLEEGNTVTIPACYAGAAEQAFAELRRVRGFLYAIASSPSREASILKALSAEAFVSDAR